VTVRTHDEALAESVAVARWYDQNSSGLGQRFLDALDAAVARVAAHPRAYARVARCPRGRDIRQALVSGFPFTVTYELSAGELVVLAVTHFRRRRQPWRGRSP
jgi:hypothetical protein